MLIGGRDKHVPPEWKAVHGLPRETLRWWHVMFSQRWGRVNRPRMVSGRAIVKIHPEGGAAFRGGNDFAEFFKWTDLFVDKRTCPGHATNRSGRERGSR